MKIYNINGVNYKRSEEPIRTGDELTFLYHKNDEVLKGKKYYELIKIIDSGKLKFGIG